MPTVTVEINPDGTAYWLATGTRHNRFTVAEGNSESQAIINWYQITNRSIEHLN